MMCHAHLGHTRIRSVADPLTLILLVAAILATGCGCPKMQSKPEGPTSRWIRITAKSRSDPANQNDPGITQHDFDQITATIPTIVQSIPERHAQVTVSGPNIELETRVIATTPRFLSLLEEASRSHVTSGRFLKSQDVEADEPVVVLNQAFADKLFSSRGAVGESVAIGDRKFKIVGVLAHSKSSRMGDVVRDVYIPLGALAAEAIQSGDNSAGQINRIWLEMDALHEVKAAREIVKAVLKRNHPEWEYSISSNFLGHEL